MDKEFPAEVQNACIPHTSLNRPFVKGCLRVLFGRIYPPELCVLFAFYLPSGLLPDVWLIFCLCACVGGCLMDAPGE